MATQPPGGPMGSPMAPAGADASQAPGAQPAEDQGYTICLRVGPGGELSVGLDDDGSDAADPNAEPADDDTGSNMRPAKDIKDALTQILAIYKADGQASADAQFDAGFGGAQ